MLVISLYETYRHTCKTLPEEKRRRKSLNIFQTHLLSPFNSCHKFMMRVEENARKANRLASFLFRSSHYWYYAEGKQFPLKTLSFKGSSIKIFQNRAYFGVKTSL